MGIIQTSHLKTMLGVDNRYYIKILLNSVSYVFIWLLPFIHQNFQTFIYFNKQSFLKIFVSANYIFPFIKGSINSLYNG